MKYLYINRNIFLFSLIQRLPSQLFEKKFKKEKQEAVGECRQRGYKKRAGKVCVTAERLFFQLSDSPA